jgi:hypothetical protein
VPPPPPTTDRAVTTPLWLSHHQPDGYARCLAVGGRHVCRRCSVVYPVAFAVLAVSLAGAAPTRFDPWVMALLPLPAVVEWFGEHLGHLAYSPSRQIATSVPLGIALGRGFARYLDDPADLAFWAMVLLYGGACLAVTLWRFLDERAP